MTTNRPLVFLAATWTFAVITAFLVALPLLAVALLMLTPQALAEVADGPLLAVLVALWPVAGIAGLITLLISRHRGAFSLRQIRARQALIVAGIVAASVAIALVWMEAGLDEAFAAVCIAAFVVLILEGTARVWVLEARAAAVIAPMDRIPGLLLGVAAASAVAAVVGHLMI